MTDSSGPAPGVTASREAWHRLGLPGGGILAELSDNICLDRGHPESFAARAAQVLAAEGYGRIALRTGAMELLGLA